MAETSADGGGPMSVLTSTFFLKTLAFVVLLLVVGTVSPMLVEENEFVGVFVGMVWSLAILIVLVMIVGVGGSALRRALR